MKLEAPLSSALVIAIQLIPNFLIPLLVAPWMDRFPRKPFLVFGDFINGIFYALMGIYLLFFDFSYVGYLGYSLLLATLGSLDELAYNSIFPKIIPSGMEQKGYAISSMLYPLLRVIMLPLAAVLMDTIGMPWLFIGQGLFSICAALIENTIQLTEETRVCEKTFSFQVWKEDLQEVLRYFKKKNVDYRLFTTIWQPQMGSLPDMLPFWSHFSVPPPECPPHLFFIFHC